MNRAEDPWEELIVERACTRLVIELVRRLDRGTPADVAELFTGDGVWEWPAGDRRVQGRTALARYFGARPADRVSRRLCTNIVVARTGPDQARGTCYFVTYRLDGATGELSLPPPANQVGSYTDEFRRVEGTWLLARRTVELAFGGDPPVRPR